jgi:hypothetical protein
VYVVEWVVAKRTSWRMLGYGSVVESSLETVPESRVAVVTLELGWRQSLVLQ